MAEGHKDRLTAIDASFLAQERSSSHMHVGAVVTLDGPPPDREEFLSRSDRASTWFRATARSSSHRARDGAAVLDRRPPIQPGVPRSLHRAARSGVGGPAAPARRPSFSQRLDRSKPLWELWWQGLDDGRFALVTKTHHADDRRRRRRGHRHCPVRPHAGSVREPAARRAGSPAPSPLRRSSWPRA